MHLADIGLLDREHVQLLVDSLQAVFVLELTPVAEALIQRGLLRSCSAICQHSKRVCFVLVTTGSGRAYVAAWIDQHNNAAQDKYPPPQVGTTLKGRSGGDHSAITFTGEVETGRITTPLDLWRCLFSGLRDDEIRNIFAEWMVGTLIGLPIESSRHTSWAVSAFVLPDQTRLKVKSRALWQSWKLESGDGTQKSPRSPANINPNRIRFGGLQARSAVSAFSSKTERRFESDIFIFCLYAQTDPAAWDDWNVANCEFYIMTREELEELKVGHSVSLATLRKFRPPMSAKEFQLYAKTRLSENLNPTAKVARRARVAMRRVKAGAKPDQRGGAKVDRRSLEKQSNG
jgi:hypothetical protein